MLQRWYRGVAEQSPVTAAVIIHTTRGSVREYRMVAWMISMYSGIPGGVDAGEGELNESKARSRSWSGSTVVAIEIGLPPCSGS